MKDLKFVSRPFLVWTHSLTPGALLPPTGELSACEAASLIKAGPPSAPIQQRPLGRPPAVDSLTQKAAVTVGTGFCQPSPSY